MDDQNRGWEVSSLNGRQGTFATRQEWTSLGAALAAVLMTLTGYWVARIANHTEEARAPRTSASAPAYAPAYGVAGVGENGICAEIRVVETDPALLVDCEKVELRNRGLDLDYPPDAERSADVIADRGILTAGERSWFVVLDPDEQPTFRKCGSDLLPKSYWLSLSQLPGHTICVRSDEGRIGIIQPETVTAGSDQASVRLTVWNKS
ncbi:hypothetical protein O7635_23425 [Asanoa sp. WMMD1127]|uniref:hypothetical protein n=1 Tax=Asanoa sp. WMMD1127 TaxID=3016107 RepID=UPI002416CD0B|nr:hypothetical protein [Asanoa sp. WMMD1127]MDG4824812.1 hypothetical protein [Asanoa sp. WMMD1127]